MTIDEIDDLLRRVARAEDEDREREATLPHVLVCRDRTTGAASHEGPYADRTAALEALHGKSSGDRADGAFALAVEPVFPPLPRESRPSR
jgi:F420-dependent methylenetetrahydromethanopterin dehydrogenase